MLVDCYNNITQAHGSRSGIISKLIVYNIKLKLYIMYIIKL